MLTEKQIVELTEYWVKSSKGNFGAMKKLYEGRQYPECLFFGHLILEKILKAHVVKKTKSPALKIHNLRRLAEIAELCLDSDDIKLLVQANEFNTEARYPDEKLEFYELCDKKYTDGFYEPIILLYKKLCQKLK